MVSHIGAGELQLPLPPQHLHDASAFRLRACGLGCSKPNAGSGVSWVPSEHGAPSEFLDCSAALPSTRPQALPLACTCERLPLLAKHVGSGYSLQHGKTSKAAQKREVVLPTGPPRPAQQ